MRISGQLGVGPVLRNWAIIGATAVALLVPACASSDSSSDRGAAPSSEADSRGDVAAFVELFTGYSADYEPAKSPRELAEWSELVVAGRMVSVIEGRVFGTARGAPGAGSTVVLEVEVSSVEKGELPAGSNGRVYVEFDSSYRRPAADYNRVTPKDVDVLLYLVRAPLTGSANEPIQDEDAGRPDGQPLWWITTPQGFLIEDDARNVTQVREFHNYSGVALEQFFPASERFPEGGGSSHEETND